MLRPDLCDFSVAYIVVKGVINVTEPENAKRNKSIHLKKMHDLSTAFQKLMVYKLAMRKIYVVMPMYNLL